MKKVADAVREIVDHDPGLKVGLAQRLMNLTQVARHIHSTVEARTQKTVEIGAITMALSRLRGELAPLDDTLGIGLADRITVQRGLAVLTFANAPDVHAGLLALQQQIRADGRHLTLTEGAREITLILEESRLNTVYQTVRRRPQRTVRGVASLSVYLTDENLTTPGVLYRLLQPLALQGISLVEVASTTSEFHLYIDENDVMLALDSLYAAFR
jgi:aspartokinase